MVPPTSSSSKQRSERRIEVRLPIKVSGLDSRGVNFEEETSSENLCRNGAAFVTRFDLPIGSDLEIRFPNSPSPTRRSDSDSRTQTDFATRGRVVHVAPLNARGSSADFNNASAASGSELPDLYSGSRTSQPHSVDPHSEKIIGVQFTGPRFRRVFRSESAA